MSNQKKMRTKKKAIFSTRNEWDDIIKKTEKKEIARRQKEARQRKVKEIIQRGKAIFLGTNQKGKSYLSLKHFQEQPHIHIIGPSGVGKTRFMVHLFRQFVSLPSEPAVIVLDPKGDLADLCFKHVASSHLEDRTTLFDTGETDHLLGYNPLKPNGLKIEHHAERVWEAIRTAWGEETFQQTPQLARWLLNALVVARAAEATFLDLLHILDFEDDSIRSSFLRKLNHPQITREWERFEVLPLRLREEIVRSTTARLHPFCIDPVIRSILNAKTYSLDLSTVMAEGGILIVNLRMFNPLSEEHVRLLGSLLVQDIITRAFERPEDKRRPIFLMVDEFQQFVSGNGLFGTILDQARSFGLYLTLAHQHLAQLHQDDPKLYASVDTNCRTKVIFGDLPDKDLELLVKNLTLGDFNPWTVKDELTSLELDPIETTRVTTSKSSAKQKSEVRVQSSSRETNWSSQESEDEALGGALTKSKSKGRGHGKVNSHVAGHGSNSGSIQGSGQYLGQGATLTPTDMLAGGEIILQNQNSGSAENQGVFDGSNEFKADGIALIDSEFEAEGDALTINAARRKGKGSGAGGSLGEVEGVQFGTSQASTVGESIGPWYEYKKRRNVTSRTFITPEEFFIIQKQRLKEQPKAHYAIKIPNHSLAFLEAPEVDPQAAPGRIEECRQKIFGRPYYIFPSADQTPLLELQTAKTDEEPPLDFRE